MTGSAQVLIASGGGRAQAFVAGLGNTSLSTGIRSAGFTLVSDGTATTSASPAGGTQTCTPWFIPTTTGIGSSYWCKFTTGSSTNTTITGTVGSVISISGASWTFANSATNQEGVGNATVAIYSDAGGVNLVATGTVNWDVGFTP